MTKEEILEQQVEALEKLLQLKQATIEELEERLRNNKSYPSLHGYEYFGARASAHCPATVSGTHEYPTPWFGTIPPKCSACGNP